MTQTQPLAPTHQAPVGFVEAISVAALYMQQQLTALVAALPGKIDRPIAMQRLLKIDYNVCWNVFNTIRAPDGMSAARVIPKRPSIKRLINACQQVGVPSDVLQLLQHAADGFDQTVRIHARNRVAFDAMVGGIASPDGQPQVDTLERRNAFRANAHIWGCQVETYVAALFAQRNQRQPDHTDDCFIIARYGFQRLRPDASAVAYSHHSAPGRPERQPLNMRAYETYGAALLPEFCTTPLPPFKRVVHEGDIVTYELQDAAIGEQAKVDLIFGSVAYNNPPTRYAGKSFVSFGIHGVTPAIRLILDLVVHRPSFGLVTPEFSVKSLDLGPPIFQVCPQQLPVQADVTRVPGGILGEYVRLSEAPMYPEILRHACQVTKWNPEEYDVYRAVVEYPILHSTARLIFAYESSH